MLSAGAGELQQVYYLVCTRKLFYLLARSLALGDVQRYRNIELYRLIFFLTLYGRDSEMCSMSTNSVRRLHPTVTDGNEPQMFPHVSPRPNLLFTGVPSPHVMSRRELTHLFLGVLTKPPATGNSLSVNLSSPARRTSRKRFFNGRLLGLGVFPICMIRLAVSQPLQHDALGLGLAQRHISYIMYPKGHGCPRSIPRSSLPPRCLRKSIQTARHSSV